MPEARYLACNKRQGTVSVTWNVASACPVWYPAFVADAFTWNVPTLLGRAWICKTKVCRPLASVDASKTVV